MIELKELLMGIAENTEPSGLLISGLALDSRYVISGDLFFALSGTQSDGRRYIGDAIERGAVAVLVEKNHRAPNGAVEGDAIPVIEIEDLAQKVSAISTILWGSFSKYDSHRYYWDKWKNFLCLFYWSSTGVVR